MDTQQTKERVCLCCNKLLAGRADKKFCDSACKSRYKRTALPIVDLPPLSSPLSVLAKFLLNYEPYWVFQGHDGQFNEEYANRYELLRRCQEEKDSFHAQYADIAEAFLCGDYNELGEENYPEILAQVAQVINDYLNHPELYMPGSTSYFRISNLYLMYFHLQSLQKIASPLIKYSGPLYIDQCFSKRYIQAFWEDLLGFKEYGNG